MLLCSKCSCILYREVHILTDNEITFVELISQLTTLSKVFVESAMETPDLDNDLLNEFVILNDYVQRINEVLSCFTD